MYLLAKRTFSTVSYVTIFGKLLISRHIKNEPNLVTHSARCARLRRPILCRQVTRFPQPLSSIWRISVCTCPLTLTLEQLMFPVKVATKWSVGVAPWCWDVVPEHRYPSWCRCISQTFWLHQRVPFSPPPCPCPVLIQRVLPTVWRGYRKLCSDVAGVWVC